MRFSTSRSDQLRLASLQRQIGRPMARDALWIADGIRRDNRYPARCITDAMVAIWLGDATLQARLPDLGQPATQRALLAWYCCEATSDVAAQAAVDDTLHALAVCRLADSGFDKLPYTGLMDLTAAHCFPSGQAPPLRGKRLSDNLIAWFYCRGAIEAGLFHHVTRQEHAALQAPHAYQGQALFALAALWALEQDGQELDLSTSAKQRDAGGRLPAAMRRQPGLNVYVAPDLPPTAAATAGFESLGVRLGAPGLPCARFRLIGSRAETFEAGAPGRRLLLAGEWQPPDEPVSSVGGAGLRPPISGLCFRLPEDPQGPWRLGLAFCAPAPAIDEQVGLRILLNGAPLWEGPAQRACGSELILGPDSRQLCRSGLNLLQCAALRAGTASSGLALRRLWIAAA